MIDDFSTEIIFDSFYTQCNPLYCSYTYSHRFDLVYVVVTIFGIFGGVSLVLRLIAPFIAKAVLFCKNRRRRNNTHNTPVQDDPVQSICDRLQRVLGILREKLVSLNFFESRPPYTPECLLRGQIATRLFIPLFISSVVGFGFYTFLSTETQVLTVHSPSVESYQLLYEEYGDSLQCPCSQLSIPYGRFLNVTFTLHQVCSSDFVSSVWLNDLSSLDFSFLLPTYATPSIDYRLVVPSYFQLLAMFCSLSQSTIEDALRAFTAAHFTNSHVLSVEIFAQETQSLVNTLVNSTRSDFERTLLWISLTTQINQILTGTNMNSYIIVANNSAVSIRDLTLFYIGDVTVSYVNIDDPCNCFYDMEGCSLPTEINLDAVGCSSYDGYFVGMLSGCVPLFGFLQSSTNWLYNSTYVEQIRLTFTESITSNSSSFVMIEPLDTRVPTRFEDGRLNETINQMLLETWISNQSHFELFYKECAPTLCSYTVKQRRSTIAAFFLLVAICGGINRALQLLLPLFVRILFLIRKKWRNRHLIRSQDSFKVRLRNYKSQVEQSLRTLNLFDSSSDDVVTVQNERLYTRVYLFLLVSSLLTIIFYSSLVDHQINQTRSITSSRDYEELRALYPDSIECPCTRISIPYHIFVTHFDVSSFHPVCNSDFVSDTWLDYLEAGGRLHDDLNRQDFRYWSTTFFHSIELFCSLAQKSIADQLLSFRETALVTAQVISASQFNEQVNATLTYVQTSLPTSFTRTLDLVRLTTQGNALITISMSNWQLAADQSDPILNASLISFPINHDEIAANFTCSCATSRSCSTPAQMFFLNSTAYYTIDGLLFSCFTIESALLSSLSCFYSMTCLSDLLTAMAISDDRSQACWSNPQFVPKPLSTTSSRFASNETLETIVQAMFIDSWSSNTSYELFFKACAPSQCTFIHHYRFDFLDVLSTFLSLFSTLALGLRFLVPPFVRIIQKTRNRCRTAPLQ